MKEMATRGMLSALKNWTNQLPTWNTANQNPQTLDEIGQAQIYGRPDETNQSDFTQQYFTNQMLQYLDPESRRETMSYLARANPTLFRRYELAGKVAPGTPQEAFDPEALKANLLAASSKLDFNTLGQSLPGFLQGEGASPSSSLGWMRDYLQTAAGGLGGTRAQQQLSAARLKTLEQEAQGKPQELGQFLTLAENMTNPIYRGRSRGGLIGGRRGTQPGDAFLRRGLVGRNPGLL